MLTASSIKRAYLAISLSNRSRLSDEVLQLRSVLEEQKIELFVFVDHYQFSKEEEKEMMDAAFQEINRSDILIAELSKKAIGVGVEVGYACARGIPIIYLRNEKSEHSTTVSGSSNEHIIYKNPADLRQQFKKLF